MAKWLAKNHGIEIVGKITSKTLAGIRPASVWCRCGSKHANARCLQRFNLIYLQHESKE